MMIAPMPEPHVDRVHRRRTGACHAAADERGADDRADDADGLHQQREDHALVAEAA